MSWDMNQLWIFVWIKISELCIIMWTATMLKMLWTEDSL